MLNQLPAGFRLLGVGEVVQLGDYVQIHRSFFPVGQDNYVGDVIEEIGPFCMIWSNRK